MTITREGKTETTEYDHTDAAKFAEMVEKFNSLEGAPLKYATVDGKTETISELPTSEAQVTIMPQYVGG